MENLDDNVLKWLLKDEFIESNGEPDHNVLKIVVGIMEFYHQSRLGDLRPPHFTGLLKDEFIESNGEPDHNVLEWLSKDECIESNGEPGAGKKGYKVSSSYSIGLDYFSA
jgi:hypothetical protein